MASVLLTEFDLFNIDSNTEIVVFDQSSSKEIEIFCALHANQAPRVISNKFTSFKRNVSLLLLIDQYSCLMYNLIFESTNNIILNSSFLLEAHKMLMNRAKL